MPAGDSLEAGALPIGLAHRVELKQDVSAGQSVRWDDVTYDALDPAVRFRREMEQRMAKEKA